MKKTELALLYMPYASADVARRHLNKCIRRNRELLGGSRSYRLGVLDTLAHTVAGGAD